MHHHTELPFVDEFRWVSPLHFVKNEGQNVVPLWCMLQVGPPFLHYCCAVVLRSSIVLPPVGDSSNHEYHCCQHTGQSSGVSNFYHTFKVFIWLTYLKCSYPCLEPNQDFCIFQSVAYPPYRRSELFWLLCVCLQCHICIGLRNIHRSTPSVPLQLLNASLHSHRMRTAAWYVLECRNPYMTADFKEERFLTCVHIGAYTWLPHLSAARMWWLTKIFVAFGLPVPCVFVTILNIICNAVTYLLA